MMEAFRLEARKYAPRWGFAAGVLTELVVLLYWLFAGHLGVTTKLLVHPGHFYQFPMVWPRWIDGLIIAIPVTLIAYLYFRSEAIRRYWTKDKAQKFDADFPIMWGMAIGVCGLWPVSCAGFQGGLIATPIVLAILGLICAADGCHYYQLGLTSVTTILTIWTGETVFLGSVAGTVYAAFIFCYTVAIVVGLALGIAALIATMAVLYVIGEYILFTFLVPRKWGPETLTLIEFFAWLKRDKTASPVDLSKAA